MKYITVLIVALCCFAACDNNKLADELFTKHILINQNGFRDYDLDYVNYEVKDTVITVAVNGSSKLDRDVTINLAVNPDTLAGYNWEKYRHDQSLYYELLPSDCYQFNGENVVIKAGTEYTDVPINFNLALIDKEKDYVLPISIISTNEYEVAEPKYSTVLMHIILSNEFTGTYSLSGTLREQATGDFQEVRMSRTLRVVDPRTVTFYAGNTSDRAKDRENYRINMTINPDSTLTYTSVNPDLIEITSDTPNLDPKNPRNKILIERTVDVQNSHRQNVVTTFYMYYNYIDKTNPEDPVELRWEGTCARTEVVYTK